MNNKKTSKQHLNAQNIETLNAMQENYNKMIGIQNGSTISSVDTQQSSVSQNNNTNDCKENFSNPSNLLPLLNLFMNKNGTTNQNANIQNDLFKKMDLNKINEIMNIIKQFQKSNKTNNTSWDNKKEEIDISSLKYIDID